MIDKKLIGFRLIYDLENLIKELRGTSYNVKTIITDDVCTLSTDNFIMSYTIADEDFYLSFGVGLPGRTVAEDMKIILTIFEVDEFIIIDDYYIDKERGIVFGLEAIAGKQNDMILNAGKVKCPICDRIFSKDKINENGICKICNMDTIVWN